MTRLAQKNRLDRLELERANDPRVQARLAAERRAQRDYETKVQLVECFPQELQRAVIDRLVQHQKLRHIRDGIWDLWMRILNQTWEPKPLPREVAEVFLAEPRATAWNRCLACDIPLPTRSGYWLDTRDGRWWQDSQHYFADCPVCHGPIVTYIQHKPVEYRHWAPLRPAPPFVFLDEAPTDDEVKHYQRAYCETVS